MSKVIKINDAEMHQSMRDLFNALNNRCFGAAGLMEGTNANTIKVANTVPYCINGVAGSFTAADNLAMNACAAQTVSTYCKYLVSILLGATTTVAITKGNEAATAALALLPDLPADSTPLGYFQVSGAVPFTSGTTDLAAVTVVYVDRSSMLTAS